MCFWYIIIMPGFCDYNLGQTEKRKRKISVNAGSKKSRHSILLNYKCLCLGEIFLPVASTSLNCLPEKLTKMLLLLFGKFCDEQDNIAKTLTPFGVWNALV